ncbi:MAG: hypothetical protein AAGG75_19610 [Bacteroidota bacterium]
MSDCFLLSQILLILLVVVLLGTIVYGLRYAFSKKAIAPRRQSLLVNYIAFGLCFWLAFLATLAYSGFFENFETLPPRILVALVPPLVLIVVLMFSPSFGAILKMIPPAWLVYIQSFRIIVEIILWLGFIAGAIPFQMTFEGFNYDIVAGVTALMAGFLFFGRGRLLRFEALIWNISGLTLLINILVIAVLSTPSPIRIFFNEPANTVVAFFPFIWLPGFLVPLAFAMHLFSLRQLWSMKPRRRQFGQGRRS